MAALALAEHTETLAKITRARDRALALYPWFGALAMNLRIKADTRCTSMATDGTYLFYNPQGCQARSEPSLIFIWAHEVMHCGLLHMYRKPTHLDWHEWNVCTDLAINGELIRLGVGERPTGILHDPSYANLSAEQIAHARRKARQQAQAEQAKKDAEQADQDARDQADQDDSNSNSNSNEDDTQDDTADDSGHQDGEQGADADSPSGDEDEQAGDGASDDDTGPSDDDGQDTEDGQPGSEDSDGQPGTGTGDASEPGQDASADATDDGATGPSAGATSTPVDAFDPDGSWQPGDDCLPPSAGQDADGQGTAPEPAPRTEADWQLAVDQVSSAMRKAGEMPGSLVTMVSATRRTRTDWREVTRAFIEQVSPSDYTWRRANRRFQSQGLYLPGVSRENLPPMMVIVDSSGSCGQDECDVFASALTDILTECKPRAIYVVYADTQVNGDVETFAPDVDSEVSLTPRGGGGTYFQPAFDWVTAAIEDGTLADPPACILYLTDGYAGDLHRLTEPTIPVLFAIVPGGTTAMPFGDVIEMEIE